MNDIKVGTLFLASIIMIGYMSYWVTSDQTGFGEFREYETIISDAAGIFEKTPIKVAGINAGKIKKIDLKGSQAVIKFVVRDDVVVSKNSYLRIKTVGMLGDKYLDINIGESGERLKNGSFIPSVSEGSIQDLTKDVSDIMSELKLILKSIRVSLEPSDNFVPLKEIITNIQSITKTTAELTNTINGFMKKNDTKVQGILDNLNQFSFSLNQLLNSEKGSLNKIANNIGPILNETKESLATIKRILNNVENGRGTVGKLLNDEEIVDQVSETLSGVNKIVKKVDAMRANIEFESGYNSVDSNRSEANLSLYPSPERFYKFGVVTASYGTQVEKEMTTTQSGVTSSVTTTEREKNSYRFNLQLGRKFHSWGVRAGIVESTGGLGLDYYLDSFSTKFSLEAFDVSSSNPNLRLISNFHIWNVFYGSLMLNDIISNTQNQNYTIGLGIKFNDDDLKGILGFLL